MEIGGRNDKDAEWEDPHISTIRQSAQLRMPLQWNEDIWKQVLEQFYRGTKDGGVVVWVVGEHRLKAGDGD